MSAQELYRSVTNTTVAELEQGAAPWLMPWKTIPANGGYLPHNAIAGRAYHGINIPILWHQASGKGYPTHAWITFKQAQERGASVRKGEKATQVVFTKKLRVKDEESDEEKQISMLRRFYVFNRAQVEGLPDPPQQKPTTERERLH